MAQSLSLTFFRYRSYTPIPFVLLMLLFHNANVWSIIAGFLIAVIGELIRFWGVSWAGSETRSTGGVGGTYLVVSGPFAYVRNPLYVGNVLMYTGIGIMSFALFPYLQIAGLLFFLTQYHFIVKGEEEYLRNTFGKDYEEFYNNVPRFFPRLTPYKAGRNVEQPDFSIKDGLRSERRSLQAFGFIAFTIVVIWLLRRI